MLQTSIIVPCTDRKRHTALPDMMARNLPIGTVNEVAIEWGTRMTSTCPRVPARNLYCGRSFQEASNAAKLLNSKLHILSAGAGLVSSEQKIPAYNLTATTGRADSISKRTKTTTWDPVIWWKALQAQTNLNCDFSETVSGDLSSLILIALSESYAKMIYNDLEKIGAETMQKIRVFGLGIETHLPENIRQNVMPYDLRLNGPDSPMPGTLSDFASRSLHHFAQNLKSGEIEGSNLEKDTNSVVELLSGWRKPEVPNRKRQSDQEVIAFIERNWHVTGGRSSRMLRHLRDSGLACEQGRFRDLFQKAREKRSPQIGTLP